MNQVHENCVIGIKKLTTSDLGFAKNGITHIGLFKNTFNFLDISKRKPLLSTLIYQNNTYDLVSIFDPITRKNGKLEAPKIRKGDDLELYVNNISMNSVTRMIREIAARNKDAEWYLLWFGFDTEELIYLLFEGNSVDYISITNIVGNIGGRKIKIGNDVKEFSTLFQFLNNKVEAVNFEYYEELEIASISETKHRRERAKILENILKKKLTEFLDSSVLNSLRRVLPAELNTIYIKNYSTDLINQTMIGDENLFKQLSTTSNNLEPKINESKGN